MRNRMSLLLAVLGLLLLGGFVVAAVEAPNILQKWVLGGGGGPISSHGYRLNSTIGQSVVGDSSSHNYRLSAGYWPGIDSGVAPEPTPTKTLTPVPGLTQRLKIPIIAKDYWSP